MCSFMASNDKSSLLKVILSDLECFRTQENNYVWHGSEEPFFLEDENVIFYTTEIFAMYEDKKIISAKLIWTTARALLYGTEVRGTIVADMVSREYETIRGLTKSDKLEAPSILGWSIPHTIITKLEIIKLGERYSIYFFENENRKFVVNDLLSSEMEEISNFMKNKPVEIVYGQFNLPWRDIFLFFCGGIFIFIIGLILIALIF
ncbi:MAG: hypothetical protein EAX86_04380 [Candidatus Heimdallarchaeota archaeon]|nr:hypothetical protein [Candidatus Heimdallarchaeota archaeon]